MNKPDHLPSTVWTETEIAALAQKFKIVPNRRLHALAEDYHFPRRGFFSDGYAPPGGYVKDFGTLWHEGRLHLFHIDGRPGELCWVTGNEISFGHASTSDFDRWIRHPMPLAVGVLPWESEHIWAPYVYSHEGLFYMFYMGSGQEQAFISYAMSQDLETWTRWAGGPITCAVGRDPFVFHDGDRTALVYTGLNGARVSACVSTDLISWTALPDLLEIPDEVAAESPSLHPLNDGHVLWFNDYGESLRGFRAAYALSKDPWHFKAEDVREFEFETRADVVPSPELKATKPLPLSIELLARGETTWLVSYFRWSVDRNKLFFGEIDWSRDPAVIREIRDKDQFDQRRRTYPSP